MSPVHRWISAQEMENDVYDVNKRLKGEFADFTLAVKVDLFILQKIFWNSGQALSGLRK